MGLRLKDRLVIGKLLRQLWPHKRFDEKKGLDDMNADSVLCIRKKRTIIGFISMTVGKLRIARVKRLVVDKNARRHGLGSKLINKAICFAKKSGCKIIWLNTGLERKASRQFYLKNGFYQIIFFTAIFIKIIK